MLRCRLAAAEQSLLGGVRLMAVRQLVRAAQGGGVPTVDLIGGDGQALPSDAVKATSGEQAVIATDQDPRGDAGPSPERRRFPIRASDWLRARFSAPAASSGETSW